MKKLLLVSVFGGLLGSTAMADDVYYEYETIPSKNGDRRAVIEMIRVTSQKAVVETEESDEEVASILKELDALEEEVVEVDETE